MPPKVHFFSLLCKQNFFPFWHLFLSLPIEHLAQVKSERNIANSRVTQLEERIATLEKEAAAAKKEAIAATQRAERAEEKEQAAAKQEEELIPRVAAVVNIMTGNFLLVVTSFFCRYFFT